MGSAPNLYVKWSLHGSELVSSFAQMFSKQEMTDVTLKCPDGSLQAHRVILSAGSELLRDIFRDLPSHFPCAIYLRDISFENLSTLIEFLYKGELSLEKEQLSGLVAACEYLMVKADLHSQIEDDPNDICTQENSCSEVEEGLIEDGRVNMKTMEGVHIQLVSQSLKQTAHSESVQEVLSDGQEEELSQTEDNEDVEIPDEADEDIDEETYSVVSLVDDKPTLYKIDSQACSSSAPHTSKADARPHNTRQGYAKHARISLIDNKKVCLIEPAGEQEPWPKPRFCKECKLLFRNPVEFREHRKSHHSLQCTECNFTAIKDCLVREHYLKVHQNIRKYQCNFCDFASKDRGTLINHRRRHTQEKPFQCGYCDYRSTQTSSMKQHVALHLNVDQRAYQCDECTRHPISFSTKSALTKHKNSHHQAKVFTVHILREEQMPEDSEDRTEGTQEVVLDGKEASMKEMEDASDVRPDVTEEIQVITSIDVHQPMVE